jgi:hypothetical protein
LASGHWRFMHKFPLSVCVSLSLSYTHFLSLSLSSFWHAGITTPVTFKLCQNELRCLQVIGNQNKPGFSSFDPMRTILLKSVPTQAFAPQPDCRCTPPRS